MLRGLLVAAVASAAAVAVPATAAADNTPSGPATLTVGYGTGLDSVVCPAIFKFQVLVAWRVRVGEGGKAGTVRPTFRSTVGDPVELPATPGTYTFPAPHINWQDCGAEPGLIQETGEHAVLVPDVTPPRRHVTVARQGQADERLDDAGLSIEAITEPDTDNDLRGDLTEDRTDLRVSATPKREVDGRLRIDLTVTNAGALSADRPRLTSTGLPAGRWDGGCAPVFTVSDCFLPALAAGESRTMVYRADAPDAAAPIFKLVSEGADLAPADNETTASFAAAPAFDVVTAETHRLTKGIKVQVRGIRAGRARVTAAFKVRGKTLKVGKIVTLKPYTARTVTVRATGAKLRSLKRAAKGGPLTAEITVRTFSGKAPVTTKTTVTR